MNKLTLVGSGKRPGEDKMPAITIPWDDHWKKIKTTGGVPGSKKFREEMTSYCDDNDVKRAIQLILQNYRETLLVTDKYRPGLRKLMSMYFDLGMITNVEKNELIREINH